MRRREREGVYRARATCLRATTRNKRKFRRLHGGGNEPSEVESLTRYRRQGSERARAMLATEPTGTTRGR